jgi:ATP10 protein
VKIDKNIIGQFFPEITSKSLAGRVVSLPGAAGGKVTLMCIAFVRSAQSMIDSWVQPFEREFGKDSSFAFYEIPMINSAWKVLSWIIDSGMKRGISIEKHDNVVTFYGDYSSYQEALGMEDINFAYVFLLDKKGIVQWKGRGYANPEIEREFIEVAKALKDN